MFLATKSEDNILDVGEQLDARPDGRLCIHMVGSPTSLLECRRSSEIIDLETLWRLPRAL